MCYRDWARVPRRLQDEVHRAYNRGRGTGTDALRHAQEAAIRAVNEQLAAQAALGSVRETRLQAEPPEAS